MKLGLKEIFPTSNGGHGGNEMTFQKELLELKTKEYMKKSYKELVLLDNNIQLEREKYKGKLFRIELEGQKINNVIHLRVECARDIFFLNQFSIAKYFAKNENDEIVEAEPF